MTIADIDPSLVTVGAPAEGGCVYTCFDENFTLPTDAVSDLPEGFVSLGDLSENGFTESKELNTTDHKGWHGNVVLTTNDSELTSYKLEFIEVNRAATAKIRYGIANVDTDNDGNVTHIGSKPGQYKALPLIIEELESNGWKRRTVVHAAMITGIDDVPHQRGNLMVYGLTFKANSKKGNESWDVYRAKPA